MKITYSSEETEPTTQAFLPPGTHTVRVTDAKETISQNGNSMIVLTLSDSSGRKCFAHLVDSPKALWFTRLFLKYSDISCTEGQEIELTPEMCLGVEVGVEVEVDERGKTRVKRFCPPQPPF